VALASRAKPAPDTKSFPPLTSAKSHNKSLASMTKKLRGNRSVRQPAPNRYGGHKLQQAALFVATETVVGWPGAGGPLAWAVVEARPAGSAVASG
jgi:hypothetical protein